jgi:hypothetical protein
MSADFAEFVHARHLDAFIEAARAHESHILVRKTGRASLQYVGKSGYTGKRADMKAKTAKRNIAPYQLEGLVCSPLIHPGACKDGAPAQWHKSAHLITIPPEGFDDGAQPGWCRTPYVLQTNRRHKHYGCIAWVENGLLTPRYVHGDYDLYAIIPAGKGRDLNALPVTRLPMPANIMAQPRSMTLPQRTQREALLESKAVTDLVGPLSFKVANFLNVKIADTEPGLLGALMVNHGEHINQGPGSQDFQEVLAFHPAPRAGEYAKILRNKQEHEEYYRTA